MQRPEGEPSGGRATLTPHRCCAMQQGKEPHMVSGGLRGNAGRRPTTNSEADGWTTLPRICDLPTPDWPLQEPTAREEELWSRLWTRPQAIMWHELMLFEEVALYVRYLAEAESAAARASVRTLVKQHQELLGLSTAGLLRNHWRISSDEIAHARAKKEEKKKVTSSRDRMVRLSAAK